MCFCVSVVFLHIPGPILAHNLYGEIYSLLGIETMPLINFSGLASGIDSESLIAATSDAARSANVKPKQDKIEELSNTNAAMDELRTLLQDYDSLADGFRTLNGGALSKLATSTDETVATASAQNNAKNTSFTLTTYQLASTGSFSFNDNNITSTTAAIAPSIVSTGNDTISITVGQGTEAQTVQLTVTATTTLDDLVSAFNTASTKAVASAVNVGTSTSPVYKFMVNTLYEGTLKGDLTIAVGTDITAAGRFTAQTLSDATDAKFSVSGISGTITRYSNKVSDVFEGITMEISKASSSTTITVGDDIPGTTSRFQELIDKVNEIVAFIHENNLIQKESDSEDALNIFAPLASISIDDNALSSLKGIFSSTKYTNGTQIKIFADLGVKTKQDGTLEFDSDTFGEAISKEANSVAGILQAAAESWGALTASNGVIDPFTRFNGMFDISISGNKELIDSLNKSIEAAEKSIAKQEDTMRQRFARLESVISKMQSQQNALESALAGL